MYSVSYRKMASLVGKMMIIISHCIWVAIPKLETHPSLGAISGAASSSAPSSALAPGALESPIQVAK